MALLTLTASWMIDLPPGAAAEDAAGAGATSAHPAAAQDPAPAISATRPATLDAEVMRTAFADLNHPDPATRRQAYERLMGMSRADLDAFRNVVDQARPILPSQAVVLREIVTQAFLSGEIYRTLPHAGFLGVKLQVVAVTTRADDANAGADAAQPQNPGDPGRVGILISECVPGFCGARSLVDGDVILNIVGHPLRMTADRFDRQLTDEFSLAVRECGPGATVTFELLRQGRVMRIPVRLDARPEALELNVAGVGGVETLDEFKNDRRRKADHYWNETFRPLLGEQVG